MIIVTIPILFLLIAAIFFFMASISAQTKLQLVPLGLLFATLAFLTYTVTILVRTR